MGLFRKRPKIDEKEVWEGAEPLGAREMPISEGNYVSPGPVENNTDKLILSKLDLIESKIKNVEQRLVTLEQIKKILDEILEANEPEKKW